MALAMLPESLEGYNIASTRIPGGGMRTTARSRGVTWVFAPDDRGWRIEQIHGGKVIASMRLVNLPPDIKEVVSVQRQRAPYRPDRTRS